MPRLFECGLFQIYIVAFLILSPESYLGRGRLNLAQGFWSIISWWKRHAWVVLTVSLGLLISQQEGNRDNRSEPGATLSIWVSLVLHPSNRTSSQGSKLKNRSSGDISDPNHSPGHTQVTAFWCPAPCPAMDLGTQLAVWLRWLSLRKSHI